MVTGSGSGYFFRTSVRISELISPTNPPTFCSMSLLTSFATSFAMSWGPWESQEVSSSRAQSVMKYFFIIVIRQFLMANDYYEYSNRIIKRTQSTTLIRERHTADFCDAGFRTVTSHSYAPAVRL